MASAFFILLLFNYSQWKNRQILHLSPPTHTHTLSLHLLLFGISLHTSLLAVSLPTHHPMSPDLKALQSVTYLLTQVRGHMWREKRQEIASN